MVEGIPVTLGGRELVIAPANLRSVKRWLKAQAEVRAGTAEFMDEVTAFCLAAVQINHPDVTAEWLDEFLTERTIPQLLAAVNEAGGLRTGESIRLPSR